MIQSLLVSYEPVEAENNVGEEDNSPQGVTS
jgi:hypothetical protein